MKAAFKIIEPMRLDVASNEAKYALTAYLSGGFQPRKRERMLGSPSLGTKLWSVWSVHCCLLSVPRITPYLTLSH